MEKIYRVKLNSKGMPNFSTAVEVADRPQGEWIVRENYETGWYRITCSECGEDVTAEAPCIGFMPIVEVLWDYCPYCGARMKGAEE